MSMLRLEKLQVRYGSIEALRGIDLHVEPGETITLIGANGAGKTTTMNAIVGLVPACGGQVFYQDKDVTRTDTKEKVRDGMILSPEGRQIFPGFTVRENLMMGAYLRGKGEAPETLETVLELFPRLRERLGQMGSTLSGGEQQMLAMGRALMSRPRLLMLDEPSMGLAPLLVEQIFEIIRELHAAGTTILLVEQNAQAALSVADRAYVLETGRVSLSGTGAELMASDQVRRAYLGG